jgi:hypothetical protein
MKPRFAFLLTLIAAVTVVATASSASAQQIAGRADIPFSFAANQQHLSAGCYKVMVQSQTQLALVNCDTGRSVTLQARTTNAYQQIHHSSLIFHSTGHKLRLYRAQFTYSNMQTDLAVQPKLEPMGKTAAQVIPSTIEIAMR